MADGAPGLAFFESLPVPVHSMGPDGRLLGVNQAWCDYTGHGREQAVGTSFAAFLDDVSAARYRSGAVPEMIGTVADGVSRSVEYTLVKASGELADIVLTARANRDEAGRFLFSVAVISDITERNRAERALRDAQKLEAVGALTSGVAHDFNNLLTIIQNSLHLLERRLPAGEKRLSGPLETALQGVMRGAALTARLLAFARRQDLAPRAVDVARLVGELQPMLLQLLGPDIGLELALDAGLWPLRADPNQLELALLNLAANSRDAMPQGGRFRLGAENVTVGESAFLGAMSETKLEPGCYVALTVSDTGQGMDEAVLARAAEPFFTTKGLGKGTGLGLSMVHGFAGQSGGAMGLSSKQGQGTSVRVLLPRSDVAAAVPAVAARLGGGGAAARAIRILLVDDDALVSASTVAMLEELGYTRVVAVASAQDALALLESDGSFGVLFTDYMMPGMSGMQLAGQARALRPGLPIVLASGFADMHEDAASWAMNSETGGALIWRRLRKPYDIEDLAAMMAALPG